MTPPDDHRDSLDWLDDKAVQQALGRAWLDTAPTELLTELTALENRMAGSEGERESAALLRDGFAAAGVRSPSLSPFTLLAWHRGETTLSITAPVERSFEAIALPYSPEAALDAPLVDVGYGTPEEIDDADVEGAVVLASTDTPPRHGRFVHRQESYGHAIEAGAVGFIFANHVEGQLPPTGALRSGRVGELPGIGVSYETGEWLRRYAAEGGAVELSVDVTTAAGTAHNVIGHLGPDTDEQVVVLAHHDAHDITAGGLDNGCGVATLVAAARVLAAFEADLDCRVRLVATSGEEIGLLGAEALADDLDLDSIRAVVNLDGVGRFRNLQAYAHGSPEMRELVDDLADAVDHPISVYPEPHPHSDHWPFLRNGVPVLQLHSDSGERGRGFTHTRADTRDKADDRAIREHGMLAALLIRSVATADLSHLSVANLAEAFREQSYERGLRAMGDWPAHWP